MAKEDILAVLKEKILAADFDDKGIAIIPLNDLCEKCDPAAFEELKASCPYELTCNKEDKTLKVYNQGDDLEAFASRHPSPQKCK